jgi:hypothetical protein
MGILSFSAYLHTVLFEVVVYNFFMEQLIITILTVLKSA